MRTVHKIDLTKIQLDGVVLIGQAADVPTDWPRPAGLEPVFAPQFNDHKSAGDWAEERYEESVRKDRPVLVCWPLDSNGQFRWTKRVARVASVAIRVTADGIVHVDKYRHADPDTVAELIHTVEERPGY